jgi:hypothetical protein
MCREPNQQSRVFCVCLGCRVEQAVEVGGSGCIYVQDTVFPIQARADDRKPPFRFGRGLIISPDP